MAVPVKGALDPNGVAICIGERILQRVGPNDAIAARCRAEGGAADVEQDVAVRIPYFYRGCPHSSSTVVPEACGTYAGIGCHYMAQWMDRSTLEASPDGRKVRTGSARRRSQAAACVQNLGDGTYNHSGYVAIRGAIASGVNITYKILFNDAVADRRASQ
jgi:indolepyruvate ferredoxin oxidoreductase